MVNRVHGYVYTSLKEADVDFLELNHAFRINGNVDLFKNSHVVHDLIQRQHYYFDNSYHALDYAIMKAKEYPKRRMFKPTDKGRMSYKEFKARKKNIKPITPEHYHWKNKIDWLSDDDLYFLSNNLGYVKIGRSKDVKKRIESFKTSLSAGGKLLGVVKNKGCMETQLHKCFSDLRVNGEWFHLTDRITRFIEKIS